MKYIVAALALVAAPVSAQNTLNIELSTFQNLVETAPAVCSKVSTTEGGVQLLVAAMDAKGFSTTEKFVMLSLCRIYVEGKLEGLRRQ